MTDRIARTFSLAALCIASALALAACGGGGGGGTTPAAKPAPATPGDETRVMPAADHPNTLGEALAIRAGQAIDGSIASADDRDFFRLPLSEPSRVTFWATGEADTVIALLDEDGNELATTGAAPASISAAGGGGSVAASEGRVSVKTGAEQVIARVSGKQGGSTGGYRLHNQSAKNRAPVVSGTVAPLNVSAGQTETVPLANAFTDPDGDKLTYTASAPGGILTVRVEGSILNVARMDNARPGSVKITITARDPFGLGVSREFTATISAPTTQMVSVEACINAARRISPFRPSCPTGYGDRHRVDFTNSCTQEVSVTWNWYYRSSEIVGGGISTGWSTGQAATIKPGSTHDTDSLCTTASQPPIRYCVYARGSSSRCYGDNPPWKNL